MKCVRSCTVESKQVGDGCANFVEARLNGERLSECDQPPTACLTVICIEEDREPSAR